MAKQSAPQTELARSSASLDSTIVEVVDRELRACLDRAAEGLHFVGPDGMILWANQTELDLLGYSREEYIGHNITEFHVDPPTIEDILARLTRGETLLNYEARLRRKDGSIRFVHINSNVLWRDEQFLHTRCFTRDITDRKAVDELAQRLADIVENSNDAIISQDLEGQITSWNPAAERMYGFGAAEAIGQSIGLVIPCGREDEEADVVRRVRNGERVAPFDTIRQHKSGAPIDVALTVSPIRNREGRIVGASKVTRDIGERKRLEARERESEHLFRALANSIANLAWMARPDGWIYWYNDQWYGYTGTTPADMEGWGWECVHDPAALPAVKKQWQDSIASGTPFEMVFPLRGGDGQFRRFVTRVNPVRDSQGHVVHWFGTNTDVENELRATEANAELRERERLAREEAELQKRLLHSLFMQAPTLIAVLRGPDHRIELANARICEAWGRTEAEIINRPLLDALPEVRDQVFPSLLDEVYRSGTPYVGQETPASLMRKGGSIETVYFNFVYSPFRGVDGEIEGIFAIASDVTDQVLARNQVNQLREAAEAANRAKDEFLAMLGHELRNPLSPILTALQLMRLRGTVGAERERTVIERQVTHLTRLVDDLLDVSRIARGKVELKQELIEVAEVVAKAVEMTSPLLEQRMHTLDLQVPRSGLPLRGDATRLSQVVSNLLTNAAKYTPAGGHITVRGSEEQGQVVLRVRDTGIGIAADALAHVFDLFVQERQALDRSHGGLGLGLTIVRNLVEHHGGTVSASSEGRGAGSEFVVRLPKAAVTEQSASPHVANAQAGVPVEASAQALRVLVVDDNTDAADMLAAVLSAKGYQTRVAHDGPAALLTAEKFRPAIAFLDLGLPVMDGYELATRLHEIPELRNLRLIAVTGYGQESDRRKTRQAGFHHHLVKPVDLQAVDEVLTEIATENVGLEEA